MSSNISINRICQHCNGEFTARTTTTQYCSQRCNRAAYKAKIRAGKIEQSNKETLRTKNRPLDELKSKEFLTVREVANLLNLSIRTAYYQIENGTIQAVNLGQRITRVKRSEIDKLFNKPNTDTPQTEKQPDQSKLELSECYNLTEIQNKFGISQKALHEIIKRNKIPKIKKGWYAYVPKKEIDKILS